MKEISVRTLDKNLITLIAEDGALLTAGSPSEGVNTMMINWGSMGYLWHKDFCFIAVRKSRHTLPLIQRTQRFSLNFFSPQYRELMQYCGRVSGRDEDKIAHCGFTVTYDSDVPYFEQASLVLQCRSMYTDEIEPRHFVNREIYERWYQGGKHEGDMHVFFLGEIVKALTV